MATPYKRRRPSLVRNFWVYRRLIALAMVLGLLLWFIWANSAEVVVSFPFGLGSPKSTVGLVILMSALFGSLVTGLGFAVFHTLRRRSRGGGSSDDNGAGYDLPDDRPPTDYAAKTTDGFPESRWS